MPGYDGEDDDVGDVGDVGGGGVVAWWRGGVVAWWCHNYQKETIAIARQIESCLLGN